MSEWTESNQRPPRCASRRTIQMGRMVAQDLKCELTEQQHQHSEGRHRTASHFGDVLLVATWRGEYEEAS